MCAMVPLMPFVLILPLTEPSAATSITPAPRAMVFTGGTSWLPVNFTCTVAALASPAPAASSTAVATVRARLNVDDMFPPLVGDSWRLTYHRRRSPAIRTLCRRGTRLPPGEGHHHRHREQHERQLYQRPRDDGDRQGLQHLIARAADGGAQGHERQDHGERAHGDRPQPVERR